MERYVDFDKVCENTGIDRTELIALCWKYEIPMLKSLNTGLIDRIYGSGLDYLYWQIDKKRFLRKISVDNMSYLMSMAPSQFLDWCREHHEELGLDISDLDGDVKEIPWTPTLDLVYNTCM